MIKVFTVSNNLLTKHAINTDHIVEVREVTYKHLFKKQQIKSTEIVISNGDVLKVLETFEEVNNKIAENKIFNK